MAFCPKCGKELPSSADFCPACGADLKGTSPPRMQIGKRSGIWYYALLLGAAIIFLSAVAYLTYGNAVAGVLRILIAVVGVYFGNKAHGSADLKVVKSGGTIAMLIGLIIIIADGTLLSFDLGVLAGGFLMTFGGLMISSGK